LVTALLLRLLLATVVQGQLCRGYIYQKQQQRQQQGVL
jgi:hypothetical protein